MATDITAADLIAAFKKRGVKYRFYKDYEDFKTHNRNHAGANTSATPGGFGPIEGVTWHNYGSSGRDIDQLAYLYRGDGPTSGKPGPLCLGGIIDDGTVVLMGWGTATHSGPGDPKVRKLAQANSMPQNGEIKPTTMGTMPGTVPVNPFYLGFEMCHGPEGPTAACLASLILATAAIMEMLGGIPKGYSGGSVVMHREWTYNRSDPQGVPKDGVARSKVTALLKKWSAPVATNTSITVTVYPKVVPLQFRHTITATVTPATAVGSVKFQWSPDGTSWRDLTFGGSATVPLVGGKAAHPNEPGSDLDHRYRAIFVPKDTNVFVGSTSGTLLAPVVNLLTLRADVEALKKAQP